MRRATNVAWASHIRGDISEQQARDQIAEAVGGIGLPDWAGRDVQGYAEDGNPGDAGELPAARVRGQEPGRAGR